MKRPLELTPYAVLGVKPTDTDETIRRFYHEIARETHPDALLGMSEPAQVQGSYQWHRATEAYNAIKTLDKREAWRRGRRVLSGLCPSCQGVGTQGTRRFKGQVKACDRCGGTGRL
jgi:DnaJ-class molecular chaperone